MWGVCFTYGIWFGVEGLLATGADPSDPAIQRACTYLLSKQVGFVRDVVLCVVHVSRVMQRMDGGWGESFRSCVDRIWTDSAVSQVVNTSWALMALLAVRCA
jgi:lanosterol synthase